MTDYEKLYNLSHKLLQEHTDLPATYDICKSRLDQELQEIKRKEEAWMFLRFYYAVKQNKISVIDDNEHNLFIWWILQVCSTVNINKSSAYTEADLPDIDVDYHTDVRDYLKSDFSFKKYGNDYVSNIASYQTYDIKSALIDMAKVLGEERNEILAITTKLDKMTDDEGEVLTFLSMEEEFIVIEQKLKDKKALTKHEQLMMLMSDYRKAHPRVWDAAKNLVAAQIDWKKYKYDKPPRRKKSMGMHASGLIISGVKLSEFVPLVTPPGSRAKGLQATAWVEGLADTDCSSIGLIKFDYLGLEANAKIAECSRLMMTRHGLDSIWALPGLSNWSDTSYLNDKKAIAMANDGDLKGVFQFDSAGIRKLVKKGGVTSFDDLVAYSALYRPGPMDQGMHDEYCDRKNGKKEYEIHPVLKPVLGKTYGVLVFQEQVMRVLNLIGNIPEKDCDSVRKAISKKKKDKIEEVKERFVENGKIKLNVDAEWLLNFFDQVVAFAGYGFNLSHAVAYTYISSRQLVQKAHYPLEFYASALRSLKTGDERITTYIHEARKKSIPVNPIILNKSKFNFEIVDDEIYYGFGKIKGIGDEIATKIVEMQPYSGLQDFLERFGTEAKVLQPLIGLRIFNEKDPHTMYLYYEAYKKASKSERDRLVRHEKALKKYTDQLIDLAGRDWQHGFDDNYFGKLRSMLDDNAWIKMCTLKKKYDKCIDTFAVKSKGKKEIVVPINEFNPKTLKLGKAQYKSYKAMKPILKDPEGTEAEVAFYGFPWRNEFEMCKNYKGFTFDDYEIDILRCDSNVALPVEVKIMEVQYATSKSGKMNYWKLRVVDVLEPYPKNVTVWEHDYDRFTSALQPGNIVRMRLFPPQPPYPNYSLEGVKPWEMRGKNPYGDDPQWDTRVVVLSRGTRKKKFIDDEDDSYLIGGKNKTVDPYEGDDDE